MNNQNQSKSRLPNCWIDRLCKTKVAATTFLLLAISSQSGCAMVNQNGANRGLLNMANQSLENVVNTSDDSNFVLANVPQSKLSSSTVKQGSQNQNSSEYASVAKPTFSNAANTQTNSESAAQTPQTSQQQTFARLPKRQTKQQSSGSGTTFNFSDQQPPAQVDRRIQQASFQQPARVYSNPTPANPGPYQMMGAPFQAQPMVHPSLLQNGYPAHQNMQPTPQTVIHPRQYPPNNAPNGGMNPNYQQAPAQQPLPNHNQLQSNFQSTPLNNGNQPRFQEQPTFSSPQQLQMGDQQMQNGFAADQSQSMTPLNNSMPSEAPVQTGTDPATNQGYLANGTTFQGSVLNPTAKTATERALDLRADNDRLRETASRHQNVLDAKERELVRTKKQLEDRENDLEQANQHALALNDEIEKLRAQLSLAVQEKNRIRKDSDRALKKIEATLDTVFMEAIKK